MGHQDTTIRPNQLRFLSHLPQIRCFISGYGYVLRFFVLLFVCRVRLEDKTYENTVEFYSDVGRIITLLDEKTEVMKN